MEERGGVAAATLALFPATAMQVTLAGMFFEPGVLGCEIKSLEGVVPPEPLAVVRDQVACLAGQARGCATAKALACRSIPADPTGTGRRPRGFASHLPTFLSAAS